MASALAYRYARALVDIVLQPGSPLKPEDAVAQLQSAAKMVAESAELRNALLTPAISPSRKRAAMGKLLEELGASQIIRNFVFVVIDHRRIGMLDEMREAFELALEERMGFARAEVVSATELDAQRSAQLETELSRLTGKRMRLRFAVDPELLGGATARIGSTLYDGSLRGQLQQMRRELTEQTGE
jgi:F-type H+-transporting ATPase subunit delta